MSAIAPATGSALETSATCPPVCPGRLERESGRIVRRHASWSGTTGEAYARQGYGSQRLSTGTSPCGTRAFQAAFARFDRVTAWVDRRVGGRLATESLRRPVRTCPGRPARACLGAHAGLEVLRSSFCVGERTRVPIRDQWVEARGRAWMGHSRLPADEELVGRYPAGCHDAQVSPERRRKTTSPSWHPGSPQVLLTRQPKTMPTPTRATSFIREPPGGTVLPDSRSSWSPSLGLGSSPPPQW